MHPQVLRFQRAFILVSSVCAGLSACGDASVGDTGAVIGAGNGAAGTAAGAAAISGNAAGSGAAGAAGTSVAAAGNYGTNPLTAGRAGGAAGTGTGVGVAGGGATAPGAAGSTGSIGTTQPGNQGGGAGNGNAQAGTGAAAGSGGGAAVASGETGRMVGMTAAHNAVRARQRLANNPAPSPALPPLAWSSDLAKTAQAYADKLAGGSCELVHSMAPGLGENLAYYGGQMSTAEQVTEGWAAEEQCYTFGTFMRNDVCDMTCTDKQFSNGCGHYTQLIWRNTSEVGCGVANCAAGQRGFSQEIWVCNYKAPGNYIGQKAY